MFLQVVESVKLSPQSIGQEKNNGSTQKYSENPLRKPRLEPVEKPHGLMLRFIYWMAPRQFGKVPTNIKVLAARVPSAMSLFSAVGKFETKGVRLDKELHYQISMLVAQTNGCGFCQDFGRMMVVKEKMSFDKLDKLSNYKTDAQFSKSEKAALAYAEEITRDRKVSDKTFGELRIYFNDREIAEITMLVAVSNLENLMNIPLQIDSDGLCAIAQNRKRE